ncbi:MAG TPA: insulinase family protein [Myxococcota bacterium]|nr:insulinase family protein [Myxococcota bacterium]
MIALLALTALGAPDRSQFPAVQPPTLLAHAAPQVAVLHPGATLQLAPSPGASKVALTVTFGAGIAELGMADEETWSAMAYLWDAATTTRDADALSIEEDIEQIELWSSGSGHQITLSLVVPRERVDKGLELLDDVLHHPAMPGADLKLYKRDQKNWYLYEAMNDPASVSSSAMRYTWYPRDVYYGTPPDLRALGKIRAADMRADHRELLRSAPVTVFAAGDLTLTDLSGPLTRILADVGVDKPAARPVNTSTPTGERLIAVDLPGAEQTSIRLRLAAPTLKDPDAIPFSAVNWALGGAFLSRLNRNLREDKGWTYGIGSSYATDVAKATWSVSVMVATANTGGAITEIRGEIAKVAADGITADEISGAWREDAATWNNTFLDVEEVAGLYANLAWTEETVDQRRQRIEAGRAISPEATQNVASRWLGPDATRLWVVVGNRAGMEAQLTAAGLRPQWIEASDAILGTFELQASP